MLFHYWLVEATGYEKELSSGRTKPIVCRCIGHRVTVDADGSTGNESDWPDGEFVIKLAGQGEMTTRGRLCEFVASLLAQALGMPVVEPALAVLSPDVWACLPAIRRRSNTSTTEPQFASKYLAGGWYTYPSGKQLESNLLDLALRIYAFDMLTRNPDRRTTRPNVLTDGETIRAYDHELAFSFLVPVLGAPAEPWQVDYHAATEHIFFRSLKGRTLDLEPLASELESIDSSLAARIRATIPPEWSSEDMGAIESHLFAVRDNASKFVEEIRRVLS